jgi:hypothetical protein
MKAFSIALASLILAATTRAGSLPPIQTVFVIVLENHNWSEVLGNPSAPFFNETLLPMASSCNQYYNPPARHPSEGNYIWLEAGTNYGVVDNNDPSINHLNTTNHLVTQLRNAGIPWKAYQEDISGDYVPLIAKNGYVPRHDPFVFFDDITGTNDPNNAFGIAHIRPYSELAGDLAHQTVARYNFITPDLCDDGHDTCAPQNDSIRQIDDWLGSEIPKIIDSAAYSNNGAIFITWDEGANNSDGPIGMVVISPQVRNGGGYSNNIHYTHSSFVRTMQEIFGVTPLLNDAANATDLSDLFRQISLEPLGWNANGAFRMNVTGLVPNSTNFVEASTDLATWSVIATNVSSSDSFSFTDDSATNHNWRFYRVQSAP